MSSLLYVPLPYSNLRVRGTVSIFNNIPGYRAGTPLTKAGWGNPSHKARARTTAADTSAAVTAAAVKSRQAHSPAPKQFHLFLLQPVRHRGILGVPIGGRPRRRCRGLLFLFFFLFLRLHNFRFGLSRGPHPKLVRTFAAKA
jgi:hypothetical protein